ncbi:MAG: 30S ribosomal protein S15 [Candidatus Diapherotrites archaeon]|nr:30S ribosomal protein S15 [Candidatus Diapherotrites archaeon]
MARMHARVGGKAGSTRPATREAPDWVTIDKNEIVELIVKMGKEGKPSSQIGLVLRDQYGISLTKSVTGKKINEILAENNLSPEIPEDLMNLITKAVKVRSHLKENKHDAHSKHNLQRIESKVRRLVKYYRRTGRLPAEWRYASDTAALLVR